MNRVNRWILSLSLIASCAGVVGLSAAKAQDQDDVMLRQQIRQYRQDMRSDQAQLNALRARRRFLIRHGGSRGQILALDQQISMLNRNILRDEEVIRRDRHQLTGWEEQTSPPGRPHWHRRWQNNHRWNNNG